MSEMRWDMQGFGEFDTTLLAPGERLLWTGRPPGGLLLRPQDLYLIPFSLLWSGFIVFWETSVIRGGGPLFFALWGIPFILMGLYFTVGRFVADALLRARTTYALTSERAIIVSGLGSRSVRALPLRTLGDVTLTPRARGRGTITLGPAMPARPFGSGWSGVGGWPVGGRALPPAFEAIPDAATIYALIRDAQRQAA
jgi:hypothetical protein